MKRLRIILISLAVLLVGVFVLCLVQPKEPSYQGRELSEWIDEFSASLKKLRTETAAKSAIEADIHAIKQIGTNAIPTLLKWAQAKEPTLKTNIKTKMNWLLDRQGVVRFRFRTPDRLKGMAGLGFQILGKDAEPAVPALFKLMESPDIYQHLFAGQLLVDIYDKEKPLFGWTGEKAVVLHLLHNSDPGIQAAAASYMARNFPEEVKDSGIQSVVPDQQSPQGKTANTNSAAQ